MKTFSFFILLFFSGLSLAYSQFTTYKGKVVDSKTKEPLGYAHLLFQNYAMGTSSNSEGRFGFSVPDSLKNESIRISYVGYFPRLIQLNKIKGNEIELTRKSENLGEVYIEQILDQKRFTYRPGSTMGSVGFGNLNAGLYPSQIAVYFEKPDKFENSCFLKEVKVYFYKTPEQWQVASKFRLHIYNVDANGQPGEELLKNYIVEREAGSASAKINLLKEKIRIPEKGFFVGVEHLFIKENQFRETKDYYLNDSLVGKDFQITKYAPIFKGELVDNDENFNAWFFGPEGWRSISEFDLSHRAFNSKIPLPSFRIKITD